MVFPPHRCAPPGATTVTGDATRPLAIAATAAAHDPVPEDCVSPTPRSNSRISISFGLRTTTYSTLVPCGIAVATESAPPGLASHAETPPQELQSADSCRNPCAHCVHRFRIDRQLLPTTAAPCRSRTQMSRHAGSATGKSSVPPCANHNLAFLRSRANLRRNAASAIARDFRLRTIGVNQRAIASASASGNIHSTPSAPTPLWRSHRRGLAR